MNYTCAKCDPTEPHPDVDFCPKCDKQSARIAELEGALRELEWRAGNHVASLLALGREPGRLQAACENARRVLGEGGAS